MATEKITKQLYNGDVEITFYPNSHQYRKDGKTLTSVTGATGMLDKSKALIPWALRMAKDYLMDVREQDMVINEKHIDEACLEHTRRKEAAASIGTQIHDWAERYGKGENPEMPEDEKVLNGVLAFLKWVDEYGVKFVDTERFLYSKLSNYVGMMDCSFTMEKEGHKILHPGDYKAAGGIYDSMLYQVAGYVGALLEEQCISSKPHLKIGSSFILRFAKEDKYDKDGNLKEEAGTFEVREISVEDHAKNYKCFLGCLALKNRDKELQKEWRARNKS